LDAQERAFLVWLWWRILAALFARYELILAPDGSKYLSRWHYPSWLVDLTARHDGGAQDYLFLHYFHQSDPDRGWHCHPWEWCESKILRGVYVQALPYFWRGLYRPAFRVYAVGDRNRLTDEYHAVSIVRGPVWTLFRAGPKHGRSWGFMNERGERWAANAEGMQ
jgi:hypothetical protein